MANCAFWPKNSDMPPLPPPCAYCGHPDQRPIATFTQACPGENLFGIAPDSYHRTLLRCPQCGHFHNDHAHVEALRETYLNDYRRKAYGDALKERFEKIMALPPAQSNNHARIESLHEWLHSEGLTQAGRLLDIGSGTAVFGAGMQRRGWHVCVIDVDATSTAHAREHAGLDSRTGYFLDITPAAFGQEAFDLLTFNKVLEHVPPATAIAMLHHAATFLKPEGWLYLELPDGEAAILHGPERSEFHLEHFGAFSAASTSLLLHHGGYTTQRLQRLLEPSGKLTLKALARPRHPTLP